jgi:hypothetical protein
MVLRREEAERHEVATSSMMRRRNIGWNYLRGNINTFTFDNFTIMTDLL